MGKDYYKQGDGKDKYAVYGKDGYEHRGKAEYATDGHMTRLDIISPTNGGTRKRDTDTEFIQITKCILQG